MTDPAGIVREQLAELGQVVAARDVDATCDLYAHDAVLAGTAGDNVGAGQIRDYVTTVLTADDGLSWDWDDVVAGTDGTVIWFYAPGWIHFGGTERFRLTGVLRHDGDRWRFAQFHGSLPETGYVPGMA